MRKESTYHVKTSLGWIGENDRYVSDVMNALIFSKDAAWYHKHQLCSTGADAMVFRFNGTKITACHKDPWKGAKPWSLL